MAEDNDTGCWTSSIAHTHMLIPPPSPQICWTSSAAHTYILIPPYTPPEKSLLSEKALHDPEPWIADTCTLEASLSAWGQYDLDLLLGEAEVATPTDDPESCAQIDLDNEIHPIFAEHNFHGVRYEALVPAIRLASLLIDTPCLMQYWYAAFSSLEEFPYANNPNKFYKAIARKRGPLTAKETAQVRLKLAALAQHVRFYGPGGRAMHGAAAHTDAQESRLNPAVTDFQGNASDIIIENDLYENLCDHYDAREFNDPTDMYLQMAAILCHEVAHAVRISRFGIHVIVGFENLPFSEEGYDWTAAIFGGILDIAYGSNSVIREWPSRQSFEYYMGVLSGDSVFVQAPPTEEADIDLEWRVPKSYIRKLFSKDFWSGLATSTDPDALKVPKLLGYRQIPAGPRGCCGCHRCLRVNFYTQWSFELGSSDKRHSADEKSLRFNKSIEREYPGYSDAELFELPCERNGWNYWPLGPWFTRKHGREAKLDWRTHGVPEGYATLADGSVILAEHLQKVAQWQAREHAEDLQLAQIILDIFQDTDEDDADEDDADEDDADEDDAEEDDTEEDYTEEDDTDEDDTDEDDTDEDDTEEYDRRYETRCAQIRKMLEPDQPHTHGVLRAYMAHAMRLKGREWPDWKEQMLEGNAEFRQESAKLERSKASQDRGDHGFEDQEGDDGESDGSGEYDSEEDDSDADYSDTDESDTDNANADDSDTDDSDVAGSDADRCNVQAIE